MERLHDTRNIWGFHIGDLTKKDASTVVNMLYALNGGRLSNLQVFRDGSRLLLNMDDYAYDAVKDFVLTYVDLSEEKRKAAKEEFPDDVKSIARVAERYLEKEEAEAEFDAVMKILRKQPLPEDPVLEGIREGKHTFAIEFAYLWGMIQGKRVERARRKNRAAQ